MTRAEKAVLFVIGMTPSGRAAEVFTDDFKDSASDLAVTADAIRDG
ncbi:MAG TPA: hypothetical protein P5316_13855 [Phycisphaerae bacterium]|nr:hypothetical protein [Phycisphaerae bacterium]